MSSITINSNIASSNAQRRFAQSTSALRDSFTRLSSGLRINKASDDAAGLAIAESLKTDQRVFNQGVRNLNDGISLLSIADGALSELSSIVIRITELAEQASNGALSNTQRTALNEEAQALKDEYLRIARTTEFNGQRLFDGEFGELRLQAGFGESGGIVSGLGGAIGTGGFVDTRSQLTSGTSVYAGLKLADLNGDGMLDLVTSSTGGATVRLGDGTGTFGTDVSFAIGASRALELGDLNGDGVLDLVSASVQGSGGGYAAVRLGDGSGSFGSVTSFTTDAYVSRALALEDINGDGALDLITAGRDGSTDGTATVRLGDGTGSFGAATSFATEARSSYSVDLGDVNGDGLLDLVTAGQDDSANGYATVRLGDGTGSFGAAQSFSTDEQSTSSLELGDLNGDGILDLVTAGRDDSNLGSATIRLGDGTGSFGPATSFSTEAGLSSALKLGDLNGDGILDLITAGRKTGKYGYATVRLGDGSGSFGAATSFITELLGSYSLDLGDVNGDGALDLVTGGRATASIGFATTRLGETTSGVSPLLDFSLSTLADARQALPVMKQKLEQLSAQRGELGAFEARVNTAVATTRVATENFAAARSQITDADVAIEAAKLVRQQILQQAGAAVLAQANQEPALALTLLS